MYEEEDEVLVDDLMFRFADPEESELGIGKSVSKEEAAEHNRDFEVAVLKENTTKVKQKVELVEDSVKGVVNKVEDVAGKVNQTEQKIEDLTAQLQELKANKTNEPEPESRGGLVIVDIDMDKVQDIHALNEEFEEKQKEQIIKENEKKTKGKVKHKREKGENKLVSSFKNGFYSTIEGLSGILGKLVAILLIILIGAIVSYTLYCISNPSETPESIAPMIDWLRPRWNDLLKFVGDVFTKIVSK